MIHELQSKLLASPLTTSEVLYIVPYITPVKEFRLGLIWGLGFRDSGEVTLMVELR